MLLPLIEIKPGMKLEQAVYSPENNQCLLNAGASLSSSNIKKFKSLGIEYLNIADRFSVYISPEDKISETLTKDFINALRSICPTHPEGNMNDNVVIIANNLEKIIHKIARVADIMPLLFEMKITNNIYLYEHSIYTSVLSGIVAGCMGLKSEEIVYIIIGSLLHNIGMCEMPFLIGQENLEGQQLELYKQHPTYGYYFAVQKNISRHIAECIQYHHEKWDGSGYPKGLSHEEIPLPARIVGMCSKYSSSIIYKKLPRYIAVEELYGTSGIYYDPAVVKTFIENIPVYPLGEVVRLSTQEVGIVSNIRANKGPRPIVKVYYNRVNRPISEDKIVDLGKERTIFIEEIL